MWIFQWVPPPSLPPTCCSRVGTPAASPSIGGESLPAKDAIAAFHRPARWANKGGRPQGPSPGYRWRLAGWLFSPAPRNSPTGRPRSQELCHGSRAQGAHLSGKSFPARLERESAAVPRCNTSSAPRNFLCRIGFGGGGEVVGGGFEPYFDRGWSSPVARQARHRNAGLLVEPSTIGEREI